MLANTNNVAYFQQYTFSIHKQNVHNKCVEPSQRIQNTFMLTNSLKRDHVFIELGLFLSGYLYFCIYVLPIDSF